MPCPGGNAFAESQIPEVGLGQNVSVVGISNLSGVRGCRSYIASCQRKTDLFEELYMVTSIRSEQRGTGQDMRTNS